MTVYRAGRPGEAEVYAIDHRDVPLALQPLMSRVYRNGRFPVDYAGPPEPPLAGAEAEWVRQTAAGAQAAV